METYKEKVGNEKQCSGRLRDELQAVKQEKSTTHLARKLSKSKRSLTAAYDTIQRLAKMVAEEEASPEKAKQLLTRLERLGQEPMEGEKAAVEPVVEEKQIEPEAQVEANPVLWLHSIGIKQETEQEENSTQVADSYTFFHKRDKDKPLLKCCVQYSTAEDAKQMTFKLLENSCKGKTLEWLQEMESLQKMELPCVVTDIIKELSELE